MIHGAIVDLIPFGITELRISFGVLKEVHSNFITVVQMS